MPGRNITPKKAVQFELTLLGVSTIVFLGVQYKYDNWWQSAAITLAGNIWVNLLAFAYKFGPVLQDLEAASDAGDIHPLVAIKDLRGHAIPVSLLLQRPKEWFLRERFDQIVHQLDRDLKDVEKGHFKIFMDDIQEPSLRVYDEISQSAFCTFLEKHVDVFFTDRAKSLREKNYQAAKRLTKHFIRLFILDDVSSVGLKTFQLMRENVANSVEVWVIGRKELNDAIVPLHLLAEGLEDRLDFGLYDNEYVMRIMGQGPTRYLYASANKSDVTEAQNIIKAIERCALSWDAFCEQVKRPINGKGKGWSSTPEKILALPAPLGPDATDADKMFAVIEKALYVRKRSRLAILGLTQLFIDRAKRLRQDAREHGHNVEVEIIDCREYRPPMIDEDVRFIQSNWLNWQPKQPYDAIVGDDILCNLSCCQLALFFETIARATKSGGILTIRTTLQYSAGVAPTTKHEVTRRLLEIKEAVEPEIIDDVITPSAVYEIAWPLMHSDGIYEKRTGMFDFNEWDRFVNAQFGNEPEFARRLRLPYDVQLSSLAYDELQELARPWYEIAQEEMEVHSVWESDPRYRRLGATDK